MFVLTTLLYPCVLALLCLGAALLVDRLSGGFLAPALLPVVGVATLIVLSQLTTYFAAVAPATPHLLAAFALLGLLVGRGKLGGLALRAREQAWLVTLPVLAYILALAPVLLAGRPSFSSYMALTDSAVHLIGADFLIHHGQDYAHLDLRNSYGQYINDYYNTGYPSGADTLFGASALLLRLPLIWAFQPFNAFVLATATGPAWLLLRRIGLDGVWAALGALTVTLGALVYAYELIGSVKEITALPMILALGALVALHPLWLRGSARGVLPFALLVAGGVAAVGVAFGAWALVAALALLGVAAGELLTGGRGARRLLLLAGGGVAVLLVGAWPTWVDFSGSLHVAQAIASTGNPGNLPTPLRPEQALGTWLSGSYLLLPGGSAWPITYALLVLALLAALLGALYVLRSRAYALAGWLALMLAAWLALTAYGSTWTDAKTLMLTSPVVLLLVWAGVAALRSSRLRRVASLLAIALAGGAIASDAMLYHSSNLAPTARYAELASLNTRFAGRGPTLFTDYDEYALYELRDLDVGGPNFIYPPPALKGLVPRNGYAIDLNRVAPSVLLSYPLIVTRRDPAAPRPPVAYRLLWQGTYYEVWDRRPRSPAALAHVALAGSLAHQCAVLGGVARLARTAGAHGPLPARSHGVELVAASAPELVQLPVRRSLHPSRWRYGRVGLTLTGPGRLQATFTLPHAGSWDVWVRGEAMRALHLSVDGHPLGALAGQVGGSSLTQQTMPPLPARLTAGAHTLTIARGGASLAPGDGGWADLRAILLAPGETGGAGEADRGGGLRAASTARWHSLCGRPLEWVEAVPAR